MEVKLDYRKYLKKNPGVILEKMPRDMFTSREYRITYLRDRGLTYQEIADVYGFTRQYIEIIMNRIVVRYMEWRDMEVPEVAKGR